MSQTYFTNFQTITYSNTQVIDLTQRVILAPNTYINNPMTYYPIQLNNNIRADNLAFKAYGDPFASWVFYLTNKINDPYYGWYLNVEEFNGFLVNKYGTMYNASNKIKYFENSFIDTFNMTVSGFNALTGNQQSFWQANYDIYGNIIDYSRRQDTIIINTNMVINFALSSNAQFNADELISIQSPYGATGQAQVVLSSNNSLTIQHVLNLAVTNSMYCTGVDSGANASISTVTYLSNNMSSDTAQYFSPVTYYEYESRLNEANKIVNVLQPQFVSPLARDIKKLLSK